MASNDAFLIDWVKGAYGMELGLAPVLEQQTTQLLHDRELRKGLDLHLEKTRRHAQLLRDYLQRRGVDPGSIPPRDPVTKVEVRANGGDPDIAFQTELIDYVTEAYEVASYRALRSLAEMIDDRDASGVFEQILGDEIAITDALDRRLPGHDGGPEVAGARAGENIRLAVEVVDALNAHDMARYEGYLTADYGVEVPGVAEELDRNQNRAMMETGNLAFPDEHFDVRRMIAAGDDVVIEWIWAGTHLGPLKTPDGPEIAATGKQVRMRGSTVLHFRGGRVAEERDYFDPGEIMQQLA
jgi:steroid delta-isomerase-like uncharacterized protein